MKLNRNRFGSEPFGESGGVNPIDGVANLADVMLVLACGLMLALVINWNVQIAPDNDAPPAPTAAIEEVEPAEGGEQSEIDADSYTEVGKVYFDPATGKYYMVVDGGSVDVEPDEVQ